MDHGVCKTKTAVSLITQHFAKQSSMSTDQTEHAMSKSGSFESSEDVAPESFVGSGRLSTISPCGNPNNMCMRNNRKPDEGGVAIDYTSLDKLKRPTDMTPDKAEHAMEWLMFHKKRSSARRSQSFNRSWMK